MILASTRWKKRADKVRRDTEQRDFLVTSEAKIRRVARAIREMDGHTVNILRAIKGGWNGFNLHNQTKHWEKFRVERYWIIEYRSAGGGIAHQSWERLIMAQAVRDGLNYHYARWLMTQGTKAREYA